MLNVIRKDLILNQTALVSNLLIMAGFLGFMSSWEEGASAGSFAFFTGIMMAFVPVMVVTREDKFRAMALGCSLPVTRKTIVQARYLLAVGTSVIGISFAFLIGAFFPLSELDPASLFRPGAVFLALSVTTVAITLLLPFTLRFGAMGLILVLAGTQVLGIVALTLVKIGESSADKRFIDTLVGSVMDLHSRLGPEVFYFLLALFLCGILMASYGLSLWVFRRREF
jgi:ABC-type transport system involved in multi-copper enzyme maturation permease subunit